MENNKRFSLGLNKDAAKTTTTNTTAANNNTMSDDDFDNLFYTGTVDTTKGFADGCYQATVKDIITTDGTAALKLDVEYNGIIKNANLKVFDATKFCCQFFVTTGIKITSLSEAIGKKMPFYVVEGNKYSAMPHLPAVGEYEAKFIKPETVNLGNGKRAYYFEWEINGATYYDFDMFDQNKFNIKIATILRAFGINTVTSRQTIFQFQGKTIPVYVVKAEGYKSTFLNYEKRKAATTATTDAPEIVKFD